MRPLGRFGIRGRLGTAFVVLSLLPALLLGIYGLKIHLHTLESMAVQRVDGSIALLKERLDGFLSLAERDIHSMRDNYSFRQYIGADAAEVEAARGRVEKTFASYLADKQAYYRFRYLDEYGDELIEIRRMPSGALMSVPPGELEQGAGAYYRYRAAELKPDEIAFIPTAIVPGPDRREIVDVIALVHPVSSPTTSELQARGVMVLEILAKEYFRILGVSELYPAGTVAVADAEGQFLYHSAYGEDWGSFLLNRSTDDVRGRYPEKIASQILRGGPGRVVAGGDEIVSYVPLRVGIESPYVLVCSLPRKVMFASMESFRKAFLGLVLGTAIIAALLAFLAARHFTGPIRSLRSGAAVLASGDLSHRIDLKTGDEVEDLAADFNVMAHALEQRDLTLRDREASFRLLFESNPHPMCVYDLVSLGFLQVNDSMLAHYGYSREELLGMTITDLLPDEERERVGGTPEQGGNAVSAGLWRHRAKDGQRIDVEILSHPIEFAGRPGCLLVAADITERKRLEEQLRQAQKMEAVGRLAGGVAHDFNNIITAILGYSEILLAEIPQPDPLRSKVQVIRDGATRAAALTNQLLTFSRKQVLQSRVLDIGEVIDASEKLLRPLLGEHIELVVRKKDSPGMVRADPTQVVQVVVNLALNARDAMPGGGLLLIEISDVDVAGNAIDVAGAVPRGSYVQLTVTDTGIGMEREAQAHLFEPFFTTKGRGKGTGLGLATVYGIVKQSGGHVVVESEPGRGSTFRVYLPRVQEPDSPTHSADPVTPAPRRLGAETVLVAEDEEPVRHFVVDVLGRLGYKVKSVRQGAEALRVTSELTEPIHLLITDVIMPGISGPELAEKLRASRPQLRVLFMSGYTDGAISDQRMLRGDEAFLSKPFGPDELARKVRQILDQANETG
ncbi:MAG: PAS domain S-box protein [Acidobacteria bacterium]|nr:PAS domain S-box protein [Acidobacteriota bacterium]